MGAMNCVLQIMPDLKTPLVVAAIDVGSSAIRMDISEIRLTYMAIHDVVQGVIDLQNLNVLVVEIGGGSTDISFLKNGELLQSTTYPLGAVRLRQDLLGVKGDLKQRIRILERQIKNTI